MSAHSTRRLRIWVISDGKAGDEMPCLGVSDALYGDVTLIRVRPRALWAGLSPWIPADPRDVCLVRDLLETQTPDIVIASGRRAVPLVRWIKKHIANVFTVILKDPRTRFSGADLIWVSEHDTLRGDHVMTTLTTPHRHSTGKLALAWATPDPRLKDLPSPRVAVLLGGNSRHHHFSNDDQARLMDNLTRLTEQGVRIMVTPSRRTPETLLAHIKALCVRTQSFFWDGTGDNPYLAILALADAVVVTADSTNMVGEAAATGKPILLFEPSGGHPKITQFLQAMMEKGYAHLFTGQLTGAPYTPIDSTPIIAERIMARMRQRAPDA